MAVVTKTRFFGSNSGVYSDIIYKIA